MNTAHVHLMLNHFSIIGSMFGLVLLTVAMVRNSRELITVSLACLAIVAIMSIPVYFTGPPAAEAITHLAGVSEEVVERHEEAAQFAFTGIECVGALALAGLWLFRTEPAPRWFLAILLLGSLLTAGVMIYTADWGRQIRHPEITGSSRLVKVSSHSRWRERNEDATPSEIVALKLAETHPADRARGRRSDRRQLADGYADRRGTGGDSRVPILHRSWSEIAAAGRSRARRSSHERLVTPRAA